MQIDDGLHVTFKQEWSEITWLNKVSPTGWSGQYMDTGGCEKPSFQQL